MTFIQNSFEPTLCTTRPRRRERTISQAAAQASAFYREVARLGAVWTIRDDGGFPAPLNEEGRRTRPFWSSRSRAEKIIGTVTAYKGSSPFEISWADFVERWVLGLTRDGIPAGVNWGGPRATGYDLDAEQLRRSVEALREQSEA